MAQAASEPAAGTAPVEEKVPPFTVNDVKDTIKTGIVDENPIAKQCLGICSALAVTTMVQNTLVMCAALIFTVAASNVLISLLRNIIPRKVRMIGEMAIISTVVIVFDQYLKAYHYSISKDLGPYVGLIITNCIVLGRAEACALSNRPVKALWDGIANGLGYSIILLAVSVVRELAGSGKLLGFSVTGPNFEPCLIMVMSAGAFFVLGTMVWITKALVPDKK
jgi:Na+-transporting NADH:ubiquinone oxidoreductase subunit D